VGHPVGGEAEQEAYEEAYEEMKKNMRVFIRHTVILLSMLLDHFKPFPTLL
jgi:hypothetical protein